MNEPLLDTRVALWRGARRRTLASGLARTFVTASLALLATGCMTTPQRSIASQAGAPATTTSVPGPTMTTAPATTTPAVATTTTTSPPTAELVSTGEGWSSSGLQGPMPAAGTCDYRSASDGFTLPDPACTPGAIDTAVTQADISRTICSATRARYAHPSR